MNYKVVVFVLLTAFASPAHIVSPSYADEGMWLFNDLPLEYLRDRYSFKPTDAWITRLMQSSVRFNSGGSGSFVSSNGLVLTNHHVASDTLHKLSTADRNLIEDGFLAASPGEELKAPDLELNRLVDIIDVTEKVSAAVTPDMSPEHAVTARRAVIAEIEKESLDRTGLRSDVVTLFGGAKYHLYRYKKYTDVRLVWAPETKIAFFGGDADNFEYPRYCLDATIMRVYEQGKPAKIESFLPWADRAVDEHELVFVSGHPGRTQRIFTVEALQYLRDHRIPYVLDYLRRKEILMQQFGLGGKEQERLARDELFGIQNSRKAYGGMLAGLQDPATIIEKQRRQNQVVEATRASEKFAGHADAWGQVAALQKQKKESIGQISSFRSRLYDLAESIVLLAAEDAKPNAQRLPEFSVANRESLLQDLLSDAPIYDDLERVKLADELSRLVELRGGSDPLVEKILNGKSPRMRAAELVSGSKLKDVEQRKRLVEVGGPLVDKSDDPLILLAKMMQPEYRRLRTQRDQIDEQEKQAYAKITEASIAANGSGGYPDATFSLRLALGTVQGYNEDGNDISAWTTMGGAFAHEKQHAGQDDYELPVSWKKAAINPATQFNFVCTADIIGGNSGSPVVNRKGELVGLIFDGNIQSLTADYIYTFQQARAVSVSGTAIREALAKVYGAGALAAQLGK